MKLKSIKQLKNLKGKKILYRVAYDITLAQKGKGWFVPDNRRIAETLPTIEYLLKQGCSLVFLSWLKRPDGKVVEKYRMDPVARELANLTRRPVTKIDSCVGLEVQKEIEKLQPGQLLMLENVRFYQQEKENDLRFARDLTKGLDLIVFDAFAQSHRDNPSTTGIMKYLPSYAGLLLEKELVNLEKVIKSPKKPLTVILGGVKISDKFKALQFLSKKADYVLVGGGLSSVFLKARGIDTGSFQIKDLDKTAVKILPEVKKICNKKNIILPIDAVSASKIDSRAKTRIIDLEAGEKIDPDWQFVDIGPKTRKYYSDIIKKSKTVLWNGPMGVFEINKFDAGTRAVAKAVANSKAISVVGGGDTEIIVSKYKLEGKFTHVSTGGGAMLKFFEGKTLPAIKPLTS